MGGIDPGVKMQIRSDQASRCAVSELCYDVTAITPACTRLTRYHFLLTVPLAAPYAEHFRLAYITPNPPSPLLSTPEGRV
ncbi:uncharacterized [Tachysurus ichikawai]